MNAIARAATGLLTLAAQLIVAAVFLFGTISAVLILCDLFPDVMLVLAIVLCSPLTIIAVLLSRY